MGGQNEFSRPQNFKFKHATYATIRPLLTQTASEKFNLIELIPKYDGSESLGIRRFLGKISDVANLDPTHSNLTEYDDIARVLISRFERTVPLSTRVQLFSSCIQGSSESVQEFAARINKLGTQIFQSSNSAQNTAARNANDQLLQSHFISGLRNDICRFVLARGPNNLEESINASLLEEQNVKLNQIANDERTGLSPLHTETSVISALTNKLDEINLRVERLQEGSPVTARKTGGGLFRRRETVFKCFYCGLEGHRQTECRRKRAEERQSNSQSPWGNAAGEFSVFCHPNTHSFDQRRVHFHDSAFREITLPPGILQPFHKELPVAEEKCSSFQS
ncbi:hypothetical protein TNCV_485531 [Trichonephila clavipes]|nr:hypothetical protein TNCV_485531 [Trichonephila clavipes]